jgi:hypothetical protein
LTWGANASDPERTSYRPDMARRFEEAYPKAHFTFWDGAIGGTGSQLGVFRLQRDCLRHHPDLVFLDFSANDDIYSDTPENMASYESLVRRIIVEGHAPVVEVFFPFKWNVREGELAKMKRRDAHTQLAHAYGAGIGDAIALMTARVAKDPSLVDAYWPIDGVHPGDLGYEAFTDAAWQGYQDAVSHKLVSHAPAKMLNADTYMSWARVPISSLGTPPQGWKVGIANRTSAWYDGLMSRWLDDETIASNRQHTVDAQGHKQLVPQTVSPLEVKFCGSMAMLFGEETIKSGKYHVFIDGKQMKRDLGYGKFDDEFDASAIKMGGNRQHAQVLATGLDPAVEHTLRIEPDFDPSVEQELRIESICVAGGDAKVTAKSTPE